MSILSKMARAILLQTRFASDEIERDDDIAIDLKFIVDCARREKNR
jgi:hypothetical protein